MKRRTRVIQVNFDIKKATTYMLKKRLKELKVETPLFPFEANDIITQIEDELYSRIVWK